MKSPLSSVLHQRIAATGSITFAEFMATALYDPVAGYYTAGPERSGWGGHFITSAQLDPAFGELWSVAFERVWEAAHRPSTFDVIEIGPGEGGFAAAVWETASGTPFGEALRLTLVERSGALRKRQEDHLSGAPVGWVSDLDEVSDAAAGCVFANEVLDNQPVHLIQKKSGELQELFVISVDEALHLTAGKLSPEAEAFLARNETALEEGCRVEISPAAESLVSKAASKVQAGAIFFVDYGAHGSDLGGNPEGTLVCYSAGGTDSEPLERAGEKDLTVFADWSMVQKGLERAGYQPDGPVPQSEALRHLGASSIFERLRGEHDSAIREKRGRDALRAISRRQALGALIDPDGLGRLGVMAGTKGITLPPLRP